MGFLSNRLDLQVLSGLENIKTVNNSPLITGRLSFKVRKRTRISEMLLLFQGTLRLKDSTQSFEINFIEKTAVLVSEQLDFTPEKYYWNFEIALDPKTTLPNVIETEFASITYTLQAVVNGKRQENTLKRISIQKLRPFYSNHLRISNGVSFDESLFKYEIQAPKEIYMNTNLVNVLVKLENPKLLWRDLELCLVQKRLYQISEKRIIQQLEVSENIKYKQNILSKIESFDDKEWTSNYVRSLDESQHLVMTFKLKPLSLVPDISLALFKIKHYLRFRILHKNGIEEFKIPINVFHGAKP